LWCFDSDSLIKGSRLYRVVCFSCRAFESLASVVRSDAFIVSQASVSNQAWIYTRDHFFLSHQLVFFFFFNSARRCRCPSGGFADFPYAIQTAAKRATCKRLLIVRNHISRSSWLDPFFFVSPLLLSVGDGLHTEDLSSTTPPSDTSRQMMRMMLRWRKSSLPLSRPSPPVLPSILPLSCYAAPGVLFVVGFPRCYSHPTGSVP